MLTMTLGHLIIRGPEQKIDPTMFPVLFMVFYLNLYLFRSSLFLTVNGEGEHWLAGVKGSGITNAIFLHAFWLAKTVLLKNLLIVFFVIHAIGCLGISLSAPLGALVLFFLGALGAIIFYHSYPIVIYQIVFRYTVYVKIKPWWKFVISRDNRYKKDLKPWAPYIMNHDVMGTLTVLLGMFAVICGAAFSSFYYEYLVGKIHWSPLSIVQSFSIYTTVLIPLMIAAGPIAMLLRSTKPNSIEEMEPLADYLFDIYGRAKARQPHHKRPPLVQHPGNIYASLQKWIARPSR